MGSENGGRGFTGDRERFEANENRELNRLDERAEAARKKRDDSAAALKRFEVHLGEAFLEKKDPPRAAVDLRRQLTEAEQTIAACEAVRPEKVRALKARQQEWREKKSAEIEARVRELVESGSALARQYKEWEAGRTAVFADIKHAAPWFPLPELPVLASKLDYVLDTLGAWPPGLAAPSGLIAVRRSTQPPKPLDLLHRLHGPVTAARAELRLDVYGPGDTFGVPSTFVVYTRRDNGNLGAEEYDTRQLLPHLGLELVEQPHGSGVTP